MPQFKLFAVGIVGIGLIVFGSGVEQAGAIDAAGMNADGIDGEAVPAGPWPVTLSVAVLALVVIGLFIWRRWYHLPRLGPSSERRWFAGQPEIGFALFAGLFLAHYLAGMAWIGAVGMPAEDGSAAEEARWSVQFYLAVMAVKALVLAGVWALWRRSGRPRVAGSNAGGIAAAAGLGLLAIVAVWPVLMFISELAMYTRSLISDEPVEAIAHETLTLLMAGEAGAWRWGLIAMVTLAVPVLEEIMYRGGLQSALRGVGLSAWWAIAATSVVFTAMHLTVIEVHAVPTLLVLSLAMGWAYERTGRLIAPIVMHILFNAANVTLALLVSEETVVAMM